MTRYEFLEKKAINFINFTEYKNLAVSERVLFDSLTNKKTYRSSTAPELIRDGAQVSYTNWTKAISPSIFHNIEQFHVSAAYEIIKYFPCTEDQPCVEWVTEYCDEYFK